MYPFRKLEEMPFEEKLVSLKPYEIDEIEKSVADGFDKHYSFFILPDGSLLDCRRPIDITHLGVTDMIYDNIDALKNDPRFEYLKLSESAIFDSGAEGMPKATATAKQMLLRRLVIQNPQLMPCFAETARYVQDDEVLAHDLGWVKVVIMKDRNFSTMVARIPNHMINGRTLKGTQKSVITDLAEIFGLDPKDIMDDTIERNNLLTREFGIMAGNTPR